MRIDRKTATIAGSVAIVAAAVALTAGTFSFFSDQGTAQAQTVRSGTLSVELGGTAQSAALDTTNAAPGTSAGSKTLTVQNTGSLPGRLTLTLVKDSDAENGCGSASERAVDSCDAAGDSGELGAKLIVTVYDPAFTDQLRSSYVNTWVSSGALDMGQLAAGATRSVPIGTWLNESVGNEIQGDGVGFHFEAKLDQVRANR